MKPVPPKIRTRCGAAAPRSCYLRTSSPQPRRPSSSHLVGSWRCCPGGLGMRELTRVYAAGSVRTARYSTDCSGFQSERATSEIEVEPDVRDWMGFQLRQPPRIVRNPVNPVKFSGSSGPAYSLFCADTSVPGPGFTYCSSHLPRSRTRTASSAAAVSSDFRSGNSTSLLGTPRFCRVLNSSMA